MALEGVHTEEVSIEDTATHSVNLAPNSATIVREVADVKIKVCILRSEAYARLVTYSPGPNEITIYGFDPLVDLDSIQITGHGPATITDTQMAFVDRNEKFGDILPEAEFGDDEELLEEEDSDDDFGVDKTELISATKEITRLTGQLHAAENTVHTSQKSKKFLEAFGYDMKAGEVDVSKLEEYLGLYQREHHALTIQGQQAAERVATLLQEELNAAKKLEKKLRAKFDRARNSAAMPERKRREEKRKAQEIARLQKERERDEKKQFRTRNIPSGFVGCSTEKKDPEASDPYLITLSITYVTRNASWCPRYELNLNTPTSSGKIVYRGEYRNYSSEIWKDAKIVLSTSQATFSGVNEVIPLLRPWTVKLLRYDAHTQVVPSKGADYWMGGLENRIEAEARSKRRMHVDERDKTVRRAALRLNKSQMPDPSTLENMAYPELVSGVVGAPNQHSQILHQSAHQMYQQTQVAEPLLGDAASSEEYDDDGAETATLLTASNALAFRGSSRQDYGLTTKYDIPGVRTLRPSHVPRRLVIAELDLPSVTFSHVVIPKLMPAAFLKAKISNTSSTTFLRGGAGLTLDGIFLGTTIIPDCCPNGTASLSLGVDPGIQVKYAKPMVRRATTGFFNKEDSALFTRTCRISNTKSTAVSILVLDQIPTSEDERLRIRILEPKGLDKAGDKAKVGSEIATSNGAWGKGFVSVGKAGEIKWELKLEKGAEVKLTLEYEARIPSGQKIAGLD
ncbi:hypothetical protein LOZ49_000146 [Ophidiomyces ophidiicola]|nr:hypothetical protein LOZ49_000146 [Ophidiomyces ophidiicola]KAI2144557.1 hypothetical protein LOZ28_001379 [Ophidiomyces ophidiicola]KAI2441845.1 hypothetical protein LOZ08_003286 [Ophidiomyces ophidiicola]